MHTREFTVDGRSYRLQDNPLAGPGFEAVPAGQAERLFRQWVFERRHELLRDLCAQLGLNASADAGETDSFVDALSAEIQRLVPVATLTRERSLASRIDPISEGAKGVELLSLAEDSDALAATDGDHFIEIQVLDEARQPLVGQRYELVLPDGKRLEGRTDDFGALRVDPIFRAGLCKVYFPDLDEQIEVAA